MELSKEPTPQGNAIVETIFLALFLSDAPQSRQAKGVLG